MIALALGRWSDAAGIWFVRERIHLRGHWTPLVHIRWRYANAKLTGFWRSPPELW